MSNFEIFQIMEKTLLSPLAVGDPTTLSPLDKVFVHNPLNRWWVVSIADQCCKVRYRNREFQYWSFDDTEFWGKHVFRVEHAQEYAIRDAVIQDRIDGIRRRGGYDFTDFIFEVPFRLMPRREVLDGTQLVKDKHQIEVER